MSRPTYDKNGRISSNGKTPTPSRVDPKFADLVRGKSPNGTFVLVKGQAVPVYKKKK